MSDVDDLQRIRLAGVRAGTWPKHSLETWREIAVPAAERYRAGWSPSPVERRALELFPELLDEAAAA